jgi:hypothetical protein
MARHAYSQHLFFLSRIFTVKTALSMICCRYSLSTLRKRKVTTGYCTTYHRHHTHTALHMTETYVHNTRYHPLTHTQHPSITQHNTHTHTPPPPAHKTRYTRERSTACAIHTTHPSTQHTQQHITDTTQTTPLPSTYTYAHNTPNIPHRTCTHNTTHITHMHPQPTQLQKPRFAYATPLTLPTVSLSSSHKYFQPPCLSRVSNAIALHTH